MGHADGLANLDLETNAFQLCPFAADVDGKEIFRESFSINVGAEDSDRNFNFFSRLPTLTHNPRRYPEERFRSEPPNVEGMLMQTRPSRQVTTNVPAEC